MARVVTFEGSKGQGKRRLPIGPPMSSFPKAMRCSLVKSRLEQ